MAWKVLGIGGPMLTAAITRWYDLWIAAHVEMDQQVQLGHVIVDLMKHCQGGL